MTPLLEWKQDEFLFISAVARNDVGLYMSFESVATVWLDAMTVEEIELPRATPTRRDNLLMNSSFEVAPHYLDWLPTDRARTVVDAQAPHGKSSLQLDGAVQSFYFPLKHNCDHALSAWMRAAQPARVTLSLRGSERLNVVSQTFDVGPAWKRYALFGPSKIADVYSVVLESQGGPVSVDAVYLTEGTKAPTYAPAQEVECSVKVLGTSRLFVRGEPLAVEVEAARYKQTAQPASFSWRLVDWNGRVESVARSKSQRDKPVRHCVFCRAAWECIACS